MTPAERDRVRALAQAIVDGAPCTDVEQAFAPMILRYVPAGDATAPSPSERDAIRRLAKDKLAFCSGSECSVECRAYRAILRYVPAGDAEHPAVTRIDDEPDIPPEFRLSVVLYRERRLQPCSARFVAAALHAAADAAEES